MITVPTQVRDFVEWHGGCTHALVWAVEVDEPRIRAMVSQARARLEGIVLPRYERQPHVTLAYAGLAPREGAIPAGHVYPPGRLEQDLRALRAVLPPRMELTLEGWSSFSMAPYLCVDAPECGRLRHALGAATSDYVPHVTIGLYGAAVPMSVVAHRMSGWSADPLRVAVESVSLLSYETHDVAGPLSRVARLRLDDGSWELSCATAPGC